jgi:hypothetical protein
MIRLRRDRVRGGVLTCAAVVLAITAFAGAAVAPEARGAVPLLEGRWHLDEGAPVGDEVSSTPDSSGNGVDAVVHYARAVTGRFGDAFGFSPATTWVFVPNSSPLLRPQHLTALAWVKASTPPGPSKYVLAQGWGNCIPAAYGMYTSFSGDVNEGGLYFYVNYGGTPHQAPGVPASKLWDGSWHMVAGTFDGSTARFYLDGVQIGNGTAVPGPIDYNQPFQDFNIGGYGRAGQPCAPINTTFQGDIDEVRIYDQALTPTEVERIADFGGTNPPPLVLDPPIVHTTGVDQVTDSSARVTGTIDDHTYPTSYLVQYGATTAYGQVSGSATSSGASGTQTVHVNLTGLDPATTYHARLVAGSTAGEDVTFHTGGLPLVRFALASESVSESAGTVTLTVQRVGDASQAATVHYQTADGTAHAGHDYASTSGTLAFNAGETSKTITVPIIDDLVRDPDKALTVSLSNPSPNVALGTPSQTQLTIIDDDPGPQTTISLDPAQPGADGYYTGVVWVTVSATDKHGGPIETRCEVDPSDPPASFNTLPPTPCPTGRLPLTTAGTHTVYAASRDRVGNTETIVSRSFRIVHLPDTTITDGPAGATWETSPQFSFTSTIPGSTFQCRLDGRAWTACKSPHLAPVSTYGDHTFEVRAIAPDGTPDPIPASRAFSLNAPTGKQLSCEVKPVYWGAYTLDWSHPDKYACQIGTPTSAGCPRENHCIWTTDTCPVGARCTVSTKLAWYDADTHVNWTAYAQSALGAAGPFGELPLFYYPNSDHSEQYCQTGWDGDRCYATAKIEVLGDGRPLFSGCSATLTAGGAVMGLSTFDADYVRRIECDADWHIEPAQPLAVVATGQTAQIYVPTSGVITLHPTLLHVTGPARDASAKRHPAIAPERIKVTHPGPVTAPLKLNRAAEQLLARRHKVAVRLQITLTTGAAKPTSATRYITITALKPRPRICRIPHSTEHLKRRPRCLERH